MEPDLAPKASTVGRDGDGEGPAAVSAEKPASTTTNKATKPRSCVVCRSRKVRCDKLSPCSNCRRANIPCVLPSTDRPPRWARRLERNAPNAAAADEKTARATDPAVSQVMDRLKTLESLVKDLSGQLEQAHAAANSSTGASPSSSTHDADVGSPSSAPGTTGIQDQMGRLVVKDASRSRYVSTGFWSRVNDVLDEIRTETRNLAGGDGESSDDEFYDEHIPGSSPSTLELDRTPSERHAFLFQHNLNSSLSSSHDFHPLPSQIPFLLDIFSDNVNLIVQIVHMPTIRKLVRPSRGGTTVQLTPVNEALLFAIYYAAITSMEEEDVTSNFGSPKKELNLKYRLGLEHALAKADFLNVPDIGLVQAFAIFLFLVRRHDSPRFVWMMTGLLIRMGQALGLQRDASHFNNFTPFEAETRRKVWYALCMLDVRASEDQGTEFTIQFGGFDTKLPLNINDNDIDVETKEMPREREGLADMTICITSMDLSNISRQIMLPGTNLEEQDRLLGVIYEKLDKGYLQYAPGMEDLAVWTIVSSTRCMAGKLTLLAHLPVLFSSPSEDLSDKIRNKLLVAAIEVAEFNHALNAEQACRHWRWIFQTYTHWHAIVYLLIDISRRQWSPIVERSWLALHSPWLIPPQHNLNKNLRIWIPLRKLVTKARKHRESELERLRGDPWAARRLEEEDRKLPLPSAIGPVSAEDGAELFRKRWRESLANPAPSDTRMASSSQQREGEESSSTAPLGSTPRANQDVHSYRSSNSHSATDQGYLQLFPSIPNQILPSSIGAQNPASFNQQLGSMPRQNHILPQADGGWNNGIADGSGLVNWFWEDPDPNFDMATHVGEGALDVDMSFNEVVDWNTWVESAKGLEMGNMQGTGPGPSV
ncbi:hypothetical protein F5Y16DRAFT_403606 [Xylariaceae sp. FL0255]|nr:hypothetical protein F5Y16DRAFT_403606 [Xylariaceae sp. FL0255]